MPKIKAIFCWSGGKDSALCLYEVLQAGEYDVKYLITTVNAEFKRVSMHGVREELLERQALEIRIPLKKIYVSEGTNAEYERQMETLLVEAKKEGINHVVFGDIFLEDLRKYREDNLAKLEMTAVFPLWKRNTKELIERFLALGFRTKICCVNDLYLGEDAAGAELDRDFIESLPSNVDPCGENGEFHSFCYEGPVFKNKIAVTTGEKIYKPLDIKLQSIQQGARQTQGFWYADLILNPSP